MKPAILIVALRTVTSLALARAGETPKIEFDQTVYDFGTTSSVPRVTGAFMLHNDGDGVLVLTNVRTSCACTRASVESTTLKPGEASMLDFSINIGPSVGDILEQIFVSSNDPQHPTVTLSLKLRVKGIYEVIPPEILLGEIRPGSTTNLNVAVRRTDGQKLRITRVVSGNPSISGQAVPVKESSGQAARIVIKLKAADAPGGFKETLYVHTGEMYAEDIPKPSFEISLKGRVAGSAQ